MTLGVCAFGQSCFALFRILNRRTARLERFALLVSVRIRARTAGGIPASRTAHNRTPGRFLLRRILHSSTASLAPRRKTVPTVSPGCGVPIITKWTLGTVPGVRLEKPCERCVHRVLYRAEGGT